MMRLFFILLVALPLQCYAQDILSLSYDEFYQIEENRKMYEIMSNNGQIEKIRDQYIPICFKEAKTEKDIEKCNCIAEEIKNIDGKVLMYESLFAYKSFQAKVAAKKAGNEEEYQRLKKIDVERGGLAKILEDKCNKPSVN